MAAPAPATTLASSSAKQLLGFLAVAIGLGILCAFFRARATSFQATATDADYDIPPFPANVVRPFSFGLRSVVADLMFLEAIQVFGGRPKSSETAAAGAKADRQLNRLLIYATDLDPQFAGAYRFAGNAMPRHTLDDKATNVRETAALLERGVQARGDDWRIWFALGFIEAYYLGEFDKAGNHLAVAAKIPGAPAYLGLLATRLLSASGDLAVAEQMAMAMADQATEDKAREEWEQRLLDLRMERHLRAIEAAAARFRARTGRNPPSIEAMAQAGDLPGVPREPRGGRYELLRDGTATSTSKPRLKVESRALSGLEVR